MSTIGKVFVVLNLILAAAFLGWAVNALKSNQEWRTRYETRDKDASREKTAADEMERTLTAKNVDLDKRNQALTSERDTLAADKKRLEESLAAERTKGTAMQASLDKLALSVDQIEAARVALQTAKDNAEKAQRDADAARLAADEARAAADKMANDKTAELEQAQATIAQMERDTKSLQDQRGALELQLDTLQANTGAKVSDFAPVPDIDAGVLDVSMAVEPGIVALNVGSNQKVKRGYTFEIFDGKTYKGQARVEYVHADMSSAIITRKVAGQTIRTGDGATTRL
jgi:hypothetical protein